MHDYICWATFKCIYNCFFRYFICNFWTYLFPMSWVFTVRVNWYSLTTMNNESTADTSQQPPSTDKQLNSKKLITAVDDTSSSQATHELTIFFLSFFMTTCQCFKWLRALFIFGIQKWGQHNTQSFFFWPIMHKSTKQWGRKLAC